MHVWTRKTHLEANFPIADRCMGYHIGTPYPVPNGQWDPPTRPHSDPSIRWGFLLQIHGDPPTPRVNRQTDGQTWLKTLPSIKLRMRAIKTTIESTFRFSWWAVHPTVTRGLQLHAAQPGPIPRGLPHPLPAPALRRRRPHPHLHLHLRRPSHRLWRLLRRFARVHLWWWVMVVRFIHTERTYPESTCFSCALYDFKQ